MKKFFLLLVAILSLATVSMTSCKKEKKTEPSCQTENMSYKNDIKPILDKNCSTSGCHDADSGQGGIFLHNYSGLNANAEKVVLSIKHDESAKPMPYPVGKEKLSDCDINKVAAWVAQGKKDN